MARAAVRRLSATRARSVAREGVGGGLGGVAGQRRGPVGGEGIGQDRRGGRGGGDGGDGGGVGGQVGEAAFLVEGLPAGSVEAVEAPGGAHPQAIGVVEDQGGDGLAPEQQVVGQLEADEVGLVLGRGNAVVGLDHLDERVQMIAGADVPADDLVHLVPLLEHHLVVFLPLLAVIQQQGVLGAGPYGGLEEQSRAGLGGQGGEFALQLHAALAVGAREHQLPFVGHGSEGEPGGVPEGGEDVVGDGHGGLAHAELARAHGHDQGDDGGSALGGGFGREEQGQGQGGGGESQSPGHGGATA